MNELGGIRHCCRRERMLRYLELAAVSQNVRSLPGVAGPSDLDR